jgi:hypothetical protein
MALPVADYERQLQWRIKQVEIGKASEAYVLYTSSYPPNTRGRGHPRTPDPYDARSSKRQFEGRIKAWKRQIHDLNSRSQDITSNASQLPMKCNFFLTAEEIVLYDHLKNCGYVDIIRSEE